MMNHKKNIFGNLNAQMEEQNSPDPMSFIFGWLKKLIERLIQWIIDNGLLDLAIIIAILGPIICWFIYLMFKKK